MACTDRVCSTLLGCTGFPAITIDGHTMRRVDLLSDLRYPKQEVAVADSDTIPLPPVKAGFVDTRRTGMTCIEDYGDSYPSRYGWLFMKRSTVLLLLHPDHDGLVRIAVFGDSFIEADIFTADLREMLQEAVWRLRCRICHNNFDDERVSSYRAAYFRRVVQSCGDGQCVFR